MPINENIFRAILISKGRVTGQPHQVILRGVKYHEKIYFSRHKPDSDWFKNVTINPEVIIKYKEFSYKGTAKKVIDKKLNQKISHLKYPDEKRANEKRIAIEITLHE